jgi:ATP/maltotriose-dependent transcriptional regulator MalT
MLDTIREYAVERLEESPEVDDVRKRHAEFFRSIAESANLNTGKMSPGGQHLEIAFEEQDNMRAALAWALARGSVELGLEIANALEQFWPLNDAAEGVRWYRAFLDHPDVESASTEVRAHALRSCASATHIGGDPLGGEPLCEQSLALFERLGDEHGIAVLLHRLGITAMVRGDLARARELVQQSHRIHEASEDWWQKTWGLAQTTGTLGGIERDLGDDDRALDLLRESAALAHDGGVAWWQAGMLAELGALSLRAGRLEEAESEARQALALAEETRDRPGRVFGVGLLACVAAERGELERAGRLWGAIEGEHAFAPLGGWQRHRDACEARILSLGTPEFERARAEGHELELNAAVELALADT